MAAMKCKHLEIILLYYISRLNYLFAAECQLANLMAPGLTPPPAQWHLLNASKKTP